MPSTAAVVSIMISAQSVMCSIRANGVYASIVAAVKSVLYRGTWHLLRVFMQFGGSWRLSPATTQPVITNPWCNLRALRPKHPKITRRWHVYLGCRGGSNEEGTIVIQNPLDQFDKAGIESLGANAVEESRTIEYKLELPGEKDCEK